MKYLILVALLCAGCSKPCMHEDMARTDNKGFGSKFAAQYDKDGNQVGEWFGVYVMENSSERFVVADHDGHILFALMKLEDAKITKEGTR